MDVISICSGFLLLVVLALGVLLIKKWDQLFGADPDWTSESAGSTSYNKMQIIVVWLLAFKLLLWATFFR